MIHTITLLVLGALIIANLVVLINISNNPMYNAMDNYNKPDKYNALDTYNDMEIVVERLKKLEDRYPVDWDSHIHDISVITERLKTLEDAFKYHIQSTDEFKSK